MPYQYQRTLLETAQRVLVFFNSCLVRPRAKGTGDLGIRIPYTRRPFWHTTTTTRHNLEPTVTSTTGADLRAVLPKLDE